MSTGCLHLVVPFSGTARKKVFIYLYRVKKCLSFFFFFLNVPYPHSVNVHVYIHTFPRGFLCRWFKQSCLHACFCSYWLSQIDGLVNGLAGGTAIHSFCPKTKLDELRTCLNSRKNGATRACASRMGWVWVFWLLLDWISSPAAASTLLFWERQQVINLTSLPFSRCSTRESLAGTRVNIWWLGNGI